MTADTLPEFEVWSEHLHDADRVRVACRTAEGAILFHIAELHDDGDLIPEDLLAPDLTEQIVDGVVRDFSEDFLVRADTSPDIRRFRVFMGGPLSLEVIELRACRKCGCADDRACSSRCSWVAKDLCSECRA